MTVQGQTDTSQTNGQELQGNPTTGAGQTLSEETARPRVPVTTTRLRQLPREVLKPAVPGPKA